jgi:hypothetical protein
MQSNSAAFQKFSKNRTSKIKEEFQSEDRQNKQRNHQFKNDKRAYA